MSTQQQQQETLDQTAAEAEAHYRKVLRAGEPSEVLEKAIHAMRETRAKAAVFEAGLCAPGRVACELTEMDAIYIAEGLDLLRISREESLKLEVHTPMPAVRTSVAEIALLAACVESLLMSFHL